VVEREFYRMDQDDAAKSPPRAMPAPKPLSRPLSLPYRVPELRQTIGAAGPALAEVTGPGDAAKVESPASAPEAAPAAPPAPAVAEGQAVAAPTAGEAVPGEKPAADAGPSDPNELLH